MAEETKMKEILKNLKNVIDRRDKLQAEGKAFHPNTPKDLQVAIDTFFIHCKSDGSSSISNPSLDRAVLIALKISLRFFI